MAYNKMTNSTSSKILLFFIIFISISFFQFKYLEEGVMKYIQFFFLAVLEIISLIYIFRTKGPFVLPVQLISISIIISMFMANFSWQQGWLDNLKATVPYLQWLFFFYFMHSRLSIKTIERIVVFWGLLYVVLYVFQLSNPSTVYFGWGNEYADDSRGIIRIIFPGGGLFFLMVFIALTKLKNKKDKYFLLWVVIVILGLVIPIVQVTRQLIASIVLIYFIHFLRETKFWVKLSTISVLSISLILFVNSNNAIITGLIEQQKNDTEQGEQYIRVLAAQYFLTEFSPNVSSQLLGNGVPYGDKSEYGKFKTNTLWNFNRFYFEDVGLIGAYALFGVFAVVGFILIWNKSFIMPLPSQYKYLKYYLWFILLTSITSDFIYKTNYLITNVIVIFLYNRIGLSIQKGNSSLKPFQQ